MEFEFSDDNDISWLIQELSVESQKANFSNIGVNNGNVEDIDDWFGDGIQSNIVSLEEDDGKSEPVKGAILYDGVVAEDISSDEEIDGM